jgi:RNA polymerase sigma-70 factor (ECF subfamily)
MDEALERTIADHLAAGELASAATVALRELGPQILGYMVSQLRDDEAGYEVFGHFSEQLWKSIGRFRGESSFKTWAYKLAMHSLARYRRDRFRALRSPLDSEISAIAADVRSRTPAYRRTEVKDRVARLREALAPDEQALLFLRIDQGLSWDEVAEVMSADGEEVAVATLRKRFERAKTRLRELAERDGLLEE